ncbi:hypothetical protein BDF20DRAFT_839820 [Mycotypha africana]|uniref:uncharacterized protein n=1 Tax=Mycotypha africana TaxID=64632 RepID=UPI00230065C0|nr:uncharacterized protein BDF20DRAFT_839820 [Mycotypha africana]KAI8967992.1 hypothetical protein BDF20DRAFT_839820 [Mycotypha africana]
MLARISYVDNVNTYVNTVFLYVSSVHSSRNGAQNIVSQVRKLYLLTVAYYIMGYDSWLLCNNVTRHRMALLFSKATRCLKYFVGTNRQWNKISQRWIKLFRYTRSYFKEKIHKNFLFFPFPEVFPFEMWLLYKLLGMNELATAKSNIIDIL